jgi:hypothetical protein
MVALLVGATTPGQAKTDAAPPPAPSRVVEMPQFTVDESPVLPAPESWHYAQYAGFEVLSNSTEGSTRRLLRDFAAFKKVLSVIWPVPTGSAPTSLILCGRGSHFERFLPASTATQGTAAASLFLPDPIQSAIVVDVQARTIALTDTGLAPSRRGSVDFEVDTDRQLFRGYIQSILSRSDARPPAWLEEGFIQLLTTMEYGDTWIRLGRIEEISAQAPTPDAGGFVDAPVSRNTTVENKRDFEAMGINAAADAATVDVSQALPGYGAMLMMMQLSAAHETARDQPFTAALYRRKLLPLEEFFAVTHDSPEARNPIGNNIWAKQAYAFLHLCLYGQKGRYQKALGQFMQRLGREPLSEELFRECFGKSYAEMGLVLRGYANGPTYQEITYKAKPGENFGGEPPLLREATQAEIGRIKGDALKLAGKKDAAAQEYRIAYLRGERDPRLLASLGLVEADAGRTERAVKFLAAATAAGVDCIPAYVELGRLRLAEALAKPAAPNGRLDSVQTKLVLEPLRAACAQRTQLAETYELIARVWAASALSPAREDIELLEKGAELFSRNGALLFNAALLNGRAGFKPRGIELATRGVKQSGTAAGRARFEALLMALNR